MIKHERCTYDTLKDNSLAPKKKFGQNFLVHRGTAEAIVRAGNIKNTDTIVEVGVGLGALTIPLAAAARHVYGYEIDSGIVKFHKKERDLPANVTLIHRDILKVDFNEIAEKCGNMLKIIANLPYSISNLFIIKLIDNAPLIDSATIMLQKEVADRLTAPPGSKVYGVPTVLLNSCAAVTRKMTLKPSEFHPRPKVDSEVITINFHHTLKKSPLGDIGEYNFSLFRRIVRTTFNQRRKTILNTLSGAALFFDSVNRDKAANKLYTKKAILSADLQPTDRPETLSTSDFIRLTRSLEKSITAPTPHHEKSRAA